MSWYSQMYYLCWGNTDKQYTLNNKRLYPVNGKGKVLDVITDGFGLLALVNGKWVNIKPYKKWVIDVNGILRDLNNPFRGEKGL